MGITIKVVSDTNSNPRTIIDNRRQEFYDDEMQSALASLTIAPNEKIVFLDLSNNNLTEKYLSYLFDNVIYLNPSFALRELNLSGNIININAMTSIAGFFNNPNCLEKLFLRNINHNDNMGTLIAMISSRNFQVKSLDLSNNSDLGSQLPALIKAIESNQSITSLELQSCKINAKGAQLLANMISNYRLLINLNISDNSINDEGFAAILKSLRLNGGVLHTLDVTGTDLSATSIHKWSEYLKNTPRCQQISRLFLDGKKWTYVDEAELYIPILKKLSTESPYLFGLTIPTTIVSQEIRDEITALTKQLMEKVSINGISKNLPVVSMLGFYQITLDAMIQMIKKIPAEQRETGVEKMMISSVPFTQGLFPAGLVFNSQCKLTGITHLRIENCELSNRPLLFDYWSRNANNDNNIENGIKSMKLSNS